MMRTDLTVETIEETIETCRNEEGWLCRHCEEKEVLIRMLQAQVGWAFDCGIQDLPECRIYYAGQLACQAPDFPGIKGL